MSLIDSVKQRLSELSDTEQSGSNEALKNAEKLADEFADIKPVPYVVPVERLAGFELDNRRHSLLFENKDN